MTPFGSFIVDGTAAAAFVVEVALKGTLVLGIVSILVHVLGRSTASLRHALWSFSIVALIAIPLLGIALPRWQIPLISDPAGAGSLSTRDGGERALEPLIGMPVLSTMAAQQTPVTQTLGALDDMATDGAPGYPLSWFDSLLLLWVSGLSVGLLTIAGGMLTLRRLSGRASALGSSEWVALRDGLTRELGITRDVRLLQSNSATMPATWGVVRPVVLLPSDANEWSQERKRVVLLHELAHVKRNDWLMQMVAQLSCATHWFNPLVWHAERRLRGERELACDERVLSAGVDACDYASHLLEIAQGFRTPAGSSLAAVAMARPSQLRGRLEAILDGSVTRGMRASRAVRGPLYFALAVLLLPLSAMRPWKDVSIVASGNLSGAPSADTFRWSGAVPAGKWVQIIVPYGDIRAEAAAGATVEITAVQQTGNRADLKIGTDITKDGTSFCAVTLLSADKQCATEVDGSLINGAKSARVDFLVKLPAGVGLAAHTGRGDIAAESMRSYVWGTSREGDVTITTSDLAEASTVSGSISAQFGKRRWTQNLEFFTETGDVTVIAPSDAAMMIEAATRNGRVRSEFPGNVDSHGAGQRAVGRVGNGRGMLTLRTEKGTVQLKRGPASGGELSSMVATNRDPKPNPNPDPGYDPDPNPNPAMNPDPNLHPDVEPAPKFAYSEASTDNPTGERVAINIPADLIARFSDQALRNAPDAGAIIRLRNIAAKHVKQHPADLVRERSQWALTLVRNGSIISPLISTLSSSDWKVRAYAAWALGETRDARATDPLTAALTDPHWRVRMHAAAGLQRLGVARTVQPLIGSLADDHWQVRTSAIDALASIGDRRAIAPLTSLAAKDPHVVVRDQARSALERLGR